MTAIPFSSLITSATPANWLATLLTNANTLGLTTSSWQSGGEARTILSIAAYAFSYEDATTALIAQGGFLDFAATGTVTYYYPDGTTSTVPVTPDPSDTSVNPSAALGLLDALADSRYNVQRILSTTAGGAEAVINTSASTYGPFIAGTYHVSDPYNSATYSNAASLTVPPSAVVGTSVSNVTNVGGLIKVFTATAHGLVTGAAVGIVGVGGVTPLASPTAWYLDVTSATSFTLRGSNFAGAYTTGGFVYTPTVAAFTADVAGSASNSTDATGTLNIHTVTQPVTSLVGVYVDNLANFQGSDIENNVALAARCRLKLQSLSTGGPRGAYQWAALSSQQLAPLLAVPLTVSAAVTRCETFSDITTGTVYVWIANAAGAPNSSDVTATNAVIQAYAVPVGVTAITAAATNSSVTVVANVWVPAALNTAATVTLFQNAINTYFSALPIGGVSDPALSYTNVVPFDAVLGALFVAGAAGSVPVQQATLTLNGGTANIALTFTSTLAQVAVVSGTPTVTLHSV